MFKEPQFLGSPRPPGMASDQKVAEDKMFLWFDYGGSKQWKNAKFRKIKIVWVPTCSDRDMLGPSQKFKIGLHFSSGPSPEVSQKVPSM